MILVVCDYVSVFHFGCRPLEHPFRAFNLSLEHNISLLPGVVLYALT